MARIGLMLYTVREDCARDFEGTLRAVASLGYEGVELFDLHGHDAAAVRGWLDELGLVACGRHAALDALDPALLRPTPKGTTLYLRPTRKGPLELRAQDLDERVEVATRRSERAGKKIKARLLGWPSAPGARVDFRHTISLLASERDSRAAHIKARCESSR